MKQLLEFRFSRYNIICHYPKTMYVLYYGIDLFSCPNLAYRLHIYLWFLPFHFLVDVSRYLPPRSKLIKDYRMHRFYFQLLKIQLSRFYSWFFFKADALCYVFVAPVTCGCSEHISGPLHRQGEKKKKHALVQLIRSESLNINKEKAVKENKGTKEPDTHT